MDGRQADPGVLVRRSWAERVDAAVGAGDAQRAAQAVESSRQSLYYDVRPVEIRGNSWTRVEAYRWKTQAVFYNEHTGKAETSFVFDLWAIMGSDPKIARYDKVMAIWRGRWEAIAQSPPAPGTKYTAGEAIDISRYDQQTGALYIDNDGLTNARRVASGGGFADSISQRKTLYLNANFFNWNGPTPGVVGAFGLSLNVSYIKVNTPDGEKTVGVFL